MEQARKLRWIDGMLDHMAAPGFDKDNWPDMANPEWGENIHKFYGKTYPGW